MGAGAIAGRRAASGCRALGSSTVVWCPSGQSRVLRPGVRAGPASFHARRRLSGEPLVLRRTPSTSDAASHANALRYLFTTYLPEGDSDMRTIGALRGPSDVSTTMFSTHVWKLGQEGAAFGAQPMGSCGRGVQGPAPPRSPMRHLPTYAARYAASHLPCNSTGLLTASVRVLASRAD